MKFVFIFLIISFFANCKSKVAFSDCKKYHQGVFLHKDPASGNERQIHRHGDFQDETDLKTGIRQTKGIVWISDCLYKLQTIATMDTAKDSGGTIVSIVSKDDELGIAKIINGTDKYYVFIAKRTAGKDYYTDTMWVSKSIGGFKSMGEIYNQ